MFGSEMLTEILVTEEVYNLSGDSKRCPLLWSHK